MIGPLLTEEVANIDNVDGRLALFAQATFFVVLTRMACEMPKASMYSVQAELHKRAKVGPQAVPGGSSGCTGAALRTASAKGDSPGRTGAVSKKRAGRAHRE